MRLTGSAPRIGERGSSTFLGRRLQHKAFTATTTVSFDPKNENEEAGMILLNESSHFDIMINRIEGKKYTVVKLQIGQTTYTSERIALSPGPVNLKIQGERSTFTFSYAQGNEDYTEIERVDAKFLSSETVGGFTGVYVGLYATGNGKTSQNAATFYWFEYKGK